MKREKTINERIVEAFTSGESVLDLAVQWHHRIDDIESVIRKALKAKDKKKVKKPVASYQGWGSGDKWRIL